MSLPDAASASADLRYLDELLARTRERVDPHAFHYVHWGLIVLVWYPLSNLLVLADRPWFAVPLGVLALVSGGIMSVVRERRLQRSPRVVGEDPRLAKRIAIISLSAVAAGMVLSFVAPATGFVRGENVPILWGLVYASMAFHTGVVYRRSFLWAGAFIFAGVLVACVWQRYNGIILGPFMGLGLIVPGMQAERSVRALRDDTAEREEAAESDLDAV